MPKTISQQISKEIKNRLLLFFLLLFVALLVVFMRESYSSVSQLTKKIVDECKVLEEFTISQSLVRNNEAITLNIDSFNKANGLMKIEWKSNGQTDKFGLYFIWPFSWTYYYPLKTINQNKFGYFEITGHFLAQKAILINLAIRVVLLIFFSIILFYLLYPLMKRVPEKIFIEPITNLLALLKYKDSSKISLSTNENIALEIQNIQNSIVELLNETKEQLKIIAIGNPAAQVAHDIRSPTAAILMLAKDCPELPEDRRIILREAAIRIQDISNNLLATYRAKDADLINLTKATEVLVSAAIASVISEKKVQSQHQHIRFITDINHAGYFAFIQIDLSAFKRMISNLINNASEAMSETGIITLILTADNHRVKIIIKDQGKGMTPELVEKIKHAEQVTKGKTDGHGLGLAHAHETINKYQGKFDIQSQEGIGTEIILSFPKLANPTWMADIITIQPGDTIVILDDDISIHGAWDQRLGQILQQDSSLHIKHFQQGLEAIDFINQLENKAVVFLLTDYELLQQTVNGLDVIKRTGVQRSIVVTSHYTNEAILKRAISMNARVLPKLLASEIEITLLEPLQTTFNNLKIDAVFIDDEDFNREFWHSIAKRKHKNLLSFASLEEFEKIADTILPNTPIYVDLNLKDINGLEVTKQLHSQGFTDIYIATGFADFKQADYPYLAGVRDKTPPF